MNKHVVIGIPRVAVPINTCSFMAPAPAGFADRKLLDAAKQADLHISSLIESQVTAALTMWLIHPLAVCCAIYTLLSTEPGTTGLAKLLHLYC